MFFSYPFQMPRFIIVCMIKSLFGSVLQYCTCTRLSCNKTLQWKSGYYTESKTEASKCCQVVISAVVLKNVTLKTKIQFGSKQRKKTTTHTVLMELHLSCLVSEAQMLLLVPWVKPVKVVYPATANTALMNSAEPTDTWVTWAHLARVGFSSEP